MGKKTLSIMPYFGGKGRMAHFLADRLDYNTSTFVSMFGGACRVLLNKSVHEQEIYNDFGSGVCAVMEVLSKPDTAQEFIDRLYYETEYSKEQFEWAKKIYDCCEIDIEQQFINKLKQLLVDKEIVSVLYAKKFAENIFAEMQEKEPKHKSKTLTTCRETLKATLESDSEFSNTFEMLLSYCQDIHDLREENNGILPRARNIRDILDAKTLSELFPGMLENESISDMDLAIATYIVFTFGFSGTGQGFTDGKFKNDDEYKKHILKLYPCAERMQGVQVYQFDAMSFFNQELYTDVIHEKGCRKSQFVSWLLNPDVMMLCDPSYIDPRHEEKLLHDEEKGIDIDVSQVDSVSEAIRQAWGDKMPNNLGQCYTRSFGYEEQEKFLQAIQYAHCKMLICNYDLALFDKYLNEETGWTKEVYPTTTSASGTSGDNERLECIWYNY